MKPLERAFHIIALAYQCGAVLPLFIRTSYETNTLGVANPLNTMANAIVLLTVLVLMVRHWATVLRLIPALTLILALLILAVASTLWSNYPDITIRRSSSLLTTMLWAWYVAARLAPKDIIKLIAQTIGLMALASLATVVLAPDTAIDAPDQAPGWRGLFGDKNNFGDVMAIGAVTYFYLMMARPRRGGVFFYYLCGLVVCALPLILSQSRTSWIIGLVGPAIVLILKLMRGRAGVAIAAWTVGIMLLVAALVFVKQEISVVAPLLGRQTDLTGRVELWSAVMPYIADRPLLGHGLAAFWYKDSQSVANIWDTIGWRPPTAHEGWLDLLLDLGFVGVAFLAAQIFFLLVRGTRAIVNNGDPDASYFLLMPLVILIHNLTESALFREGVMWVLIVVSTVALAKISETWRASATEGWKLHSSGVAES